MNCKKGKMSLTDLEVPAFLAGIVAPGGNDFGTGIGFIASALTLTLATPLPGLSAEGCASRMARRLLSPRTGVRFTNTQPTFGTGLPPIKRPSSNNHSY